MMSGKSWWKEIAWASTVAVSQNARRYYASNCSFYQKRRETKSCRWTKRSQRDEVWNDQAKENARRVDVISKSGRHMKEEHVGKRNDKAEEESSKNGKESTVGGQTTSWRRWKTWK